MASEITLEVGADVCAQGRAYRILRLVDLEVLVAIDVATGGKHLLRISDVHAPATNEQNKSLDNMELDRFTEADWDEARKKYAAIEPLLGPGKRSTEDVKSIAKQQKVTFPTIYRWIDRFSQTGTLVSLVRRAKLGGRGKPRISAEAEAVIKQTLDASLLSDIPPSQQSLCRQVLSRCRALGITSPHENTVRARIRAVPERLRVAAHGTRREKERFEATPGTISGADFPLQLVQIDHTPLDIQIVDERFRKPIGRAWLTLVIDVNSRVVPGFYLDLHAPSALSVGLALVHAICGKESQLAELGIGSTWPIWGKPVAVHSDNAGEFRGEVITRACQNRGIDIHWRPVKKPRYGAHIERLLGTFNTLLKQLPGRTGANIKERGDANPEASATFTLRELEKYLITYVVDIYHRQKHGTLGIPPLTMYEKGIHGTAEKHGRGLPARVMDERRLTLDFLPSFERTVQGDGVQIEKVQYFSPSIRKHVGARTVDTKKAVKFLIRRHPKYISPIYFLDPDLNEYVEVPYANLSRPIISAWELDAAKRKLKIEGKAAVDEDAIFRGHERLAQIERESADKSKTARRKVEQRRARDALLNSGSGPLRSPSPPAALEAPLPDAARTPVMPYTEVEAFDD